MEDIEAMTERHKREIAELRSQCKHKDVSNWMTYMWAPGHCHGEVRVCEFCGEIVETRGQDPLPATTYTSDE